MNKTIGITLVVMAAAIAGTFGIVHTAFAQTSSSSAASVQGGSASAANGGAQGAASASGANFNTPASCTANSGIAGPTGGVVVIGGGVGQAHCP